MTEILSRIQILDLFEEALAAAEVPILGGYYATLGLLSLYGLHRLVLLVLLWRGARPLAPPASPSAWPAVTVQLPIYNELFVSPRLIEAVCALDYPRDRLEIQVLDDSTDETSAVLARLVKRHRQAGIDIHHLRRGVRTGFKAGALEEGQRCARGELLAIFDADFVPEPDFLRRTVPHFADPLVGMVQTRWQHLNRDYSLLTRVQAILLDGHFLIEHAARFAAGRFFNFNGTAGIWRKRAIVDAGGWQHDTLTEDLDLSYRAQLGGWKFVYRSDVETPAELPSAVSAFKSQQRRWARGSAQTARKLLPRLLRSPLPWAVRGEALVHLTNNFCYVLMVALSLLVFPAMVLRRGTESWKLLAIDLPLFAAATLSIMAFYLASQRLAGRSLLRELTRLPAVMALGMGLCLNNGAAVLAGLLRMGGTFVRTPKFRIEDGDGATASGNPRLGRRLYASRAGLTLPLELLFGLYFVLSFALGIHYQMWWSLPFLWLFLQGFVSIAWIGLRERLPLSAWPELPLEGEVRGQAA